MAGNKKLISVTELKEMISTALHKYCLTKTKTKVLHHIFSLVSQTQFVNKN